MASLSVTTHKIDFKSLLSETSHLMWFRGILHPRRRMKYVHRYEEKANVVRKRKVSLRVDCCGTGSFHFTRCPIRALVAPSLSTSNNNASSSPCSATICCIFGYITEALLYYRLLNRRQAWSSTMSCHMRAYPCYHAMQQRRGQFSR